MSAKYDIIVVGAGVAGPTFAHALSKFSRESGRPNPVRIAVLERSLAEPDRIVGELLQPGGVMALQKIGMESCLENIDAVPAKGYCVVHSGQQVHIPYPDGFEGRSFHHGKFITALREKVRTAPGVELIEATVNTLVEDPASGRVIGVTATSVDEKGEKITSTYSADLVVVADGCFSNFRTSVMGTTGVKPSTKSHFIGALLKDAKLPIDMHGTVVLVPGSGPVLLYRVDAHETRILIDIHNPLPSDIKSHILDKVIPHLPSSLHIPAENAIKEDRLRRMPNSFYPGAKQGNGYTKEGVILLGDAWNMRHPLTGGGMTVALNDVVQLATFLNSVEDWNNWDDVSIVLHRWHWSRKPLSSTINILSVALYDLFGAEDEDLAVLRHGCFKYFERGGTCVSEPVSLLAGIAPSPWTLLYHFFSVAFYSIWILFTQPRPMLTGDSSKLTFRVASWYEYPLLLLRSISVFWTACIVFGPLAWSEIRWW